MNLEKQTVKLTVSKIVKRQQGCGPDLFYVYVSVPTISKDMKVKGSSLTRPIVCTAKHFLPIKDGYKQIEDVKIGDQMLLTLDLIC